MKKIFIVILFYSALINATFGKSYQKYHLKTHDAEILISESNYGKALNIYEGIFNEFENHFTKDLNNAYFCSLLMKKYENAAKYAEELVLKGFKLKYFKEFNSSLFYQTKEWKRFEKKYLKLRKQYLNSFDEELVNTYAKIFDLDQKVLKSGDTKLIHQTYYKNAKELSYLYEKYGFITRVETLDGQLIDLLAPLRHYCRMVNEMKQKPEKYIGVPYQKMNIDSLPLINQFKVAVYEGMVLPMDYASAISYGKKKDDNDYGVIQCEINFDTKKLSLNGPKDLNRIIEINKNRNDIGLFAINLEDTSVLKNTWYADYPINKVIEIFKKSGKKRMDGQLFMAISNEELKVQNAFDKKNNPNVNFILDLINIEGVYYKGYEKYLK